MIDQPDSLQVGAVRTARAEGIAQIVIMLAIGVAAGAASFTHVHNVAASHGQSGWIAWADAVVLELCRVSRSLTKSRDLWPLSGLLAPR